MKALTYVEIDVPAFIEGSPSGDTQTFRFAKPTTYLPNDIECIPSIDEISFQPMRVSLGEDLGQRADLRISFRDHKHRFGAESFDQGTFFGKWRGRYGTKLRGRAIRLIRGYVGQALADMETRHYVVEATNGPTLGAVYTIEAKDILKFADEDRAQAPVLSNGSLAGSITNSQTSLTLTPAGIGDLEYPASGFVSIGGKEVVSFTRSGNSMTITRAQFGSVAQAHDAGDRVQLVLRYAGDDAADIIRDLLVNYAAVPDSYITIADWQAETGANLGVLYARTISEPTSVKKLISELIEQAALTLFWDDRARQIRLTVLREIDTANGTFNHDNIIEGSLRVTEQPLKRISQIWTFYGQRDPTDTAANEDNYRSALADVDLETETEYGSPEIRKIQAAWIETETAASRLNAIQLSRFRDPPRQFAFQVFAGTSVSPAAGYTIEWWGNQDSEGNEVPAKIQVTKVGIFPDRIEVEAEEMLASGELPAVRNVVFLTTTGGVFTWTVPDDWNDADNSIEGIGAGGGGGASGIDGGRGGGGGAYARTNNVSLTPGASVSYRIGEGGEGGADDEPPFTSVGEDGGDTWFGNAVFASALMGAKGGEGGSGRTGGGSGGQAADSIGDVTFSGGDGGTGAPKGDSRAGGGGGGGAAGPNGDGGGGGNNTSTGDDDGAGGGGADGGGTGLRGNSGGGRGGHNRFNFGGGTEGLSGDEGGGGGGGQAGGVNGGPGGSGEQVWTQTINPITSAGPGGGGGGAGDGNTAGSGGLYGGGGGGNGGDGSSAHDGAQGIIVITWREA